MQQRMVLKIIEKFHSVKEENLSHQNENYINLPIKFFQVQHFSQESDLKLPQKKQRMVLKIIEKFHSVKENEKKIPFFHIKTQFG